ncbi:phospholipase D-like domain-containing protein (plasmid) [Rhizobium sp. T1470]|uniref:phospholipase D-like domain-containing protein n=1 Tax=unclassified Rhizobium TaxID=2613769 RepID=UPI001AAEA450|nr:phospholipase D-like domain-containing protein [Rhizobium sp. T1473]MCA0805976.1 phospholipase D-like domain-containing protein [Rhizobium sp. T1473]
MRVRASSTDQKFQVFAVAGTRAILLALNLDENSAQGLRGFAFRRRVGKGVWEWLTGLKVFKALFPDGTPVVEKGKVGRFPTNVHPIQSFLWSDYQAKPETEYEFEVSAMFGPIGTLEARYTATVLVTTEAEDDGKHGIWFNRGAIASQAFAEYFGNKSLTEDEYNEPGNEEVAFLSRGLLEACLRFIRETPAGDALRVAAYEFTFKRVQLELKAALERGVDVQIVYHATGENDRRIDDAKLPRDWKGEQVLYRRTRPPIPHNKFIVRLEKGKVPVSVWTGSTNFTPSGFLGQTNVGHKVTDRHVAEKYLELWEGLKLDPDDFDATEVAMKLTPNPSNVVDKGTTLVFSPRPSAKMLDWYGQRVADAVNAVMFTAAFKVDERILGSIADNDTSMRFILLEQPPSAEVEAAKKTNPADVELSYGAVLGKTKMLVEERVGHNATGKNVTKIVPIPDFELESWFLKEELERQSGDGFVFYVHTKFLLVDPLSSDPLVCTGSANFSGNSLTSNDENMVLIRGDTRVADIYLTEYDRVFRHFYSRDVINDIAKRHGPVNVGKLDDEDKWWRPYFNSDNAKSHKRRMFFEEPSDRCVEAASKDGDVFAKEKKLKRP